MGHKTPTIQAWYTTLMIYILGLLTFVSTLLGGLFAIKRQDKLHLILGFSAGAVIGVAFFDLLPEALELVSSMYPPEMVTSLIAVGFLFFMLLSRTMLLHPHVDADHHDESIPESVGKLEAGSLSIHSLLDGIGMGLAFQVSPSVGAVMAAAVLAHDFSDGINTVSFILKHKGNSREAMKWLIIDATAPFIGIISTRFFSLPSAQLGLILSLFCGFFLYIGASDLLPESQHQHPKLITSMMTIMGATAIFIAIHAAGF